ncbi:TraR/DksA family transcriptional regulator [Phaeobacter inhibens]|uniref:TraR/DksA family transcriptional regulator n=1 Tax=Phaeobacter inhibens TaxID=221822 RepID=UPI000C9B3144|nr:hypothetical protein [Phaeobacter inhibens]AUR08471.1 transcriptional regulator, TraR/DksA family [Phaeobacter inhibens]AUR12305.1 transcriptional regulator, TraR/DksA family [Phaeobacter inhibens]
MNHAAHKDILTHLRNSLPAARPSAGAAANIVPLKSRRSALVVAQPTEARVIAQPSDAALNRKWLELRRDIDCALARVDEGSYGYCQICGDRITDSHLSDHPTTPFCASCSG